MIILKSRSSYESTRTSIGSLLVIISLFIWASQETSVALTLLISGIALVSFQKKVKIEVEKKKATHYNAILTIPMPLSNNVIDLNTFDSVILYQISEKGSVQTKTKTMAYRRREYWIKLKSPNGNVHNLGYTHDYNLARKLIISLSTMLNYKATDNVQAKLKRNKIDRDKRLGKRQK